ncbi:hypothetical protein ACIFQM_03950 [Paenibacillus sp. NRS-1782]|uniref:hypothetical protein n=1 Tax=unclassified Paenibacillus TaxID=185978 RepID=UPI003D2856EE
MLNSSQRRFKKEMEKIQKEQSKQQEVYSYVHDEHVKGYYSDGNGKIKLSPFVKFFRVVMYILVSIISLFGAIAIFTSGEPVG